MMTFMCIQQYQTLNISLENFKLIIGIHLAIETNSFGISNSELVRIGTAVYMPSNFFNHSCSPNAFIKFSGKKQFVISNQRIKEGDEITISYVNHGQPEPNFRRKTLLENYLFDCKCQRCSSEANVHRLYYSLENFT